MGVVHRSWLPTDLAADHRGMTCSRLLCLLIICWLTACAGRGPKTPVIPRQQALRWETVLRGEVIQVYDGLHHSRDPHVSHLVEVRLEEAPGAFQGQTITFPFDEWSSGQEPPGKGEEVVFMPQMWVAVDPRSMGRPR